MGGVSLQILNLQTELNYLDSVNIFKIFSVLTWPHPSTHPPTKLYTTYGWGSLHRFQIFKQNLNTSISSSVIEFWLISGVPPGFWMRVGVGGWGGGGERVPPTHVHMHMHAHICTCIWHHREFPGIPPMGAAICNWNYHVNVYVCACTCMYVHVCWVHPQPPPPPEPQGAQNTKIQ